MSVCAYCSVRPAVNLDHVIPRSVLRNRLRRVLWGAIVGTRRVTAYFDGGGHEVPVHLLDLAPACHECNTAKSSRLLIPASWADRLDELNALGIGTFRVWRGDVESLRGVVR